MKRKKVLFSGHSINYSIPDNFSERDRKLFYDCNFKNEIAAVELAQITNVTVCNNVVFKVFYPLYELTRHTKPSNIKLIKSLVKKTIKKSDFIFEACLGIQEWNGNYFHWMTETLPALLAMYNIINRDIPVLLDSTSKKYKFIEESLELSGITPYYYDIHNPIRIEKLYAISVPIVGAYNEGLLLIMRSFFIEKLNFSKEIKPFKKIYISRRNAKRRKIVNEKELINLLQNNGFETVFLEDYTLDKQIKLLFETQIVVAPHGAGLSNTMFMSPNTSVIELKAKNNDYWCFFSLARLSKLQYRYLLCESDNANHRSANIIVDLEEIKNLLNVSSFNSNA